LFFYLNLNELVGYSFTYGEVCFIKREALKMKKVTVFIGSPRKQATYQAAQEFAANLKSYGEIDIEYVFLKDYHLEYCRGCKSCFVKGEEFCPLKDDRDILLEKMNNSDGIIFATPNYSFQVSALMKTFLDRLGFVLHRPRFFGKAFTAVGCCLTALEPMIPLEQKKISQEIKKASVRFYNELTRQTLPAPSFFRLMVFRMSRTSIRLMLDEKSRDYRHYKEKGWFESDYYYDASLGIIKKLTGHFFEFLGKRMATQR